MDTIFTNTETAQTDQRGGKINGQIVFPLHRVDGLAVKATLDIGVS